MGLTNSASSVTYQGNGALKSFDFTFVVWDSSDVALYITDSNGVDTTVSSNFSVALNENGTGTVTYPVSGDALASGNSLTIRREMDYLQDFFSPVNNAAFLAETLEASMDRIVALVQQTKTEVDRCVRVGVTGDLPAVVGERTEGNCLAWNADGDLVSVPVSAADAALAAIEAEFWAGEASAQATVSLSRAILAAQAYNSCVATLSACQTVYSVDCLGVLSSCQTVLASTQTVLSACQTAQVAAEAAAASIGYEIRTALLKVENGTSTGIKITPLELYNIDATGKTLDNIEGGSGVYYSIVAPVDTQLRIKPAFFDCTNILAVLSCVLMPFATSSPAATEFMAELAGATTGVDVAIENDWAVYVDTHTVVVRVTVLTD